MPKNTRTKSRVKNAKKRRECSSMEMLWVGTFDVFGPLVGAIIGIVVLAIGVSLLDYLNGSMQNVFLSAVSVIIGSNFEKFFGAFLFFGYGNFLSSRFPQKLWPLRPAVVAVKVIFVIWIIFCIFSAI
jgi:hypothetical protein